MPKIDAIREALRERDQKAEEIQTENFNFARALANGFRDYLGLPTTFKNPALPKPGEHYQPNLPYVVFREVKDDGSTEEVAFPPDAITSFWDGRFRFAFAIRLDHSEGHFPKQPFVFKIECRRQRNGVSIEDPVDLRRKLQFEDGKIVDEATAFQDLEDYILAALRNPGSQAAKVGFALTPTTL